MSLVNRVKGKLNHYKPEKIFQRLDQKKSREKLGHGAGYTMHMEGERDIENALPWSGEPSPEAREMKEKGFALLPPYDKNLIEDIQAQWKECIYDDEISGWSGPATRQIKMPQVNFPIAKKLLTPEILDHFRAYYGTEVKIFSMVCWRNHDPKEKRKDHVFSNWWHFDAANTAITKIFIAISDIDEDCGPFHIYPKKQSKELIDLGYIDRRNYGNAPLEDYEGLYRMIGPAGTAVITNTELCLHRAGEPINGNIRDMVQFQILPSSEPFDENWADNLQNKGIDRK